ncbi:hypothetical protein K466DRAFT_297822 [Polyporus arcularius HHB13444]|uniref:Uncharacterized protein n=1 Tax=Polyporus arcularius HHB13444 TaxID=1314778 RepID=A0A5C3P9R0_9APHY|nr:hypothetical protein K466DRAFT_297822 [Polyporus arcularius HHB13444]
MGALKLSVVRRSSERRSLDAVHITHEVSLSLVRPDTVSPSTADIRTTPLGLRQFIPPRYRSEYSWAMCRSIVGRESAAKFSRALVTTLLSSLIIEDTVGAREYCCPPSSANRRSISSVQQDQPDLVITNLCARPPRDREPISAFVLENQVVQ